MSATTPSISPSLTSPSPPSSLHTSLPNSADSTLALLSSLQPWRVLWWDPLRLADWVIRDAHTHVKLLTGQEVLDGWDTCAAEVTKRCLTGAELLAGLQQMPYSILRKYGSPVEKCTVKEEETTEEKEKGTPPSVKEKEEKKVEAEGETESGEKKEKKKKHKEEKEPEETLIKEAEEISTQESTKVQPEMKEDSSSSEHHRKKRHEHSSTHIKKVKKELAELPIEDTLKKLFGLRLKPEFARPLAVAFLALKGSVGIQNAWRKRVVRKIGMHLAYILI